MAAFDEKTAINVITHVATNAQFKAITVHADVRDEKSVKSIIFERVKAFGRLDYAVSCAAIGLTKANCDTETPD